jgi:hypothetical protein
MRRLQLRVSLPKGLAARDRISAPFKGLGLTFCQLPKAQRFGRAASDVPGLHDEQ